jgi:glutathione S-transferase
MKLHWSPRSPYVRKTVVAIFEKGLDGQIEFVRSVVPTDDFNHAIFTDNPFGQIPTLVDGDGTAWFGSSIILERLDLLHAEPRMFPNDARLRVETRSREALGEGVVDITIGLLLERLNPSQQTATIQARLLNKLTNALGQLERTIDRYAGFDAGSIAVASALAYIDFRFPSIKWREERKALTAWYAKVSERPSMIRSELKEG